MNVVGTADGELRRGAGHRRARRFRPRSSPPWWPPPARRAAREAARGHRPGAREVKLLLATSNPGSCARSASSVGACRWSCSRSRMPGCPRRTRTGDTFEENAAQKAPRALVRSGLWALADDSGLCVDALDGGPGSTGSLRALRRRARSEKLLRALQGVPEARRAAHFFCALALACPDGQRGFAPQGGWTAPSRRRRGARTDSDTTRSSCPLESSRQDPGGARAPEKNRLSHRGRALERLLPDLTRLAREGAL